MATAHVTIGSTCVLRVVGASPACSHQHFRERPQVGGYDPLLDDSVDFNTRIRRLGVPGELSIYRSLPHTFVSFPHWHLMPEVQEAMREASDWLVEWLWVEAQADFKAG